MYSVVIPSVGRFDYLNELLESIYKQTIFPEEIIVVFDNNKKCRDIENSIAKKFNLRVIYTDKLSTPQKRNIGVNVSKTNIIIFSDDDDYWESNKGELTIESLKSFQVVCHAYTKFGYSIQKPKYHLGKITKNIPLFYLIFGDNIFGGGSGIAGKKEIFLSIPFNDNFYSEDYDWWIKIFLADIKVQYLAKSLVRYRSHKTNMTLDFLKIYSYNARIFNKIFIKSFILFCTFLTGYIKIIIKIIYRIIRSILFLKTN